MPRPPRTPRAIERLPQAEGLYRLVDLTDANSDDVYALGLPAARAKAEWLLGEIADAVEAEVDADGSGAVILDGLRALSRVAEAIPAEGEHLAMYVAGSRGATPLGIRVQSVATSVLSDGRIVVPVIALGWSERVEDVVSCEPEHVADIEAYGDVWSIGDLLADLAIQQGA